VLGIKQNAKYNENDIDIKFRDHALFISFAPADNPKIAVAVVVENGGHGGSVAAPIAGQVIKQFLQENDEHWTRSEQFQPPSLLGNLLRSCT